MPDFKLLLKNDVHLVHASLNEKGAFVIETKEGKALFSEWREEDSGWQKVEEPSGKCHWVFIEKTAHSLWISYEGVTHQFQILDPKRTGKKLSETGVESNEIKSPMPGKVVKVLKKVGDLVQPGETILVVEAMKMEHSLKAALSGVIERIECCEGDQVAKGAPLVKLRQNLRSKER